MTAFLLDLDGTTVHFGTNKLIDGKLEEMIELTKAGHQIIFLTARAYDGPGAYQWPPGHVFTKEGTQPLLDHLKEHGINVRILFGVLSPRIVINDAGAHAITCEKNKPLGVSLMYLAREAERKWGHL